MEKTPTEKASLASGVFQIKIENGTVGCVLVMVALTSKELDVAVIVRRRYERLGGSSLLSLLDFAAPNQHIFDSEDEKD